MALSNAGHRWTEQETLLAMDLYCRVPFGQITARNPEIADLARLLGRSPASVSMKMCNLARFDPSLRARNVSGLANGSKLDEEIFKKYYGRFDELAIDAYQARLTLNPLTDVLEYDAPKQHGGFNRLGHIKQRVGQDFFRASVLSAYDGRCCITGLRNPDLLIASHIKPWSQCTTPAERTDPRNGLCLNVFHDAAFDKGLITIDKTNRIVFSRELYETEMGNPMREWILSTRGQMLQIPERFGPSAEFLEYHNNHVFRGPNA